MKLLFKSVFILRLHFHFRIFSWLRGVLVFLSVWCVSSAFSIGINVLATHHIPICHCHCSVYLHSAAKLRRTKTKLHHPAHRRKTEKGYEGSTWSYSQMKRNLLYRMRVDNKKIWKYLGKKPPKRWNDHNVKNVLVSLHKMFVLHRPIRLAFHILQWQINGHTHTHLLSITCQFDMHSSRYLHSFLSPWVPIHILCFSFTQNKWYCLSQQ